MLNISLCFNRKDFEYDVYSLIKAFYPGCEITSWYEEDGALDGEFAYYDIQSPCLISAFVLTEKILNTMCIP